MFKRGDLVMSRNGEWGWVERFGGPACAPWAMVRNIDGYAQSFGLHGLRRPEPDRDWEIFANIEEAQQLRQAAE